MISSSLGTLAIAAVMIVTGTLMLASVFRGAPESPAAGPAQGEVVLVATKAKKKSKRDA